MQWVDVVAAALLVGAATAFGLGEVALARAQDLEALYLMVVGVVGTTAAVRFGRPGGRR